MDQAIREQIEENIRVKNKLLDLGVEVIGDIVNAVLKTFQGGGKLLMCGNGGSAADSQHFAAEFVSSYNSSFKRPSLPAIALSTDTSILTAFTNDFGGEGVFARQVEGLGNAGDLLIVLSTSGNSKNVVRAVEEARRKKITTVGFLGRDGGELGKMVDIPFIVPSDETPRIQEVHILAYHIVSDLVERKLFAPEYAAEREKGTVKKYKDEQKSAIFG